MSRHRIVLFVSLALVTFSFVACQLDMKLRRLPRDEAIVVNVAAPGDAALPGVVGPEVLMEGSRVFDERCSPCHGIEGRGDGPLAHVLPVKPRNYQADAFKWGTRPSDIAETIRRGRSSVMPPFDGELSPREIWATAFVVWHWIPAARREMDAPDELGPLSKRSGS